VKREEKKVKNTFAEMKTKEERSRLQGKKPQTGEGNFVFSAQEHTTKEKKKGMNQKTSCY